MAAVFSEDRISSIKIYILLAAVTRELENATLTHKCLRNMFRAMNMIGAHNARNQAKIMIITFKLVQRSIYVKDLVANVKSVTRYDGHCRQTVNIPSTSLRIDKKGNDSENAKWQLGQLINVWGR